jgi:molybdopterin/thiamine biosynthesis adenylyltransferase
MALSEGERERYARQLVLPEFGEEAQVRLRAASVLVVGAGALGSAATLYLAGAGVGRLGVVDDERVEVSNLHRQPLYIASDVGTAKAAAAVATLSALNPEVSIEPYPARLEPANAAALVEGQDVVVDCTDRLETRYVVNEACCAAGVALVEGGVLGLAGQVLSVRPGRSACYRCVFPSMSALGAETSCAEVGILGPVAGVVGSLQALEAIKLITGLGEPLLDRMLEIDGGGNGFTLVRTTRRDGCPDCGSLGATL